MFKNVASQKLTVLAFADAGHASLDAGDKVTGDAAQITLKVEQDDDGTQSASNDTNPTEIEDGQYVFDLTQAETNGDKLTFYPESSTGGVQVVALPSNVIYTRPPNFPSLGIESDGDLTKVNALDGHTAQTGDTYALANGTAGFVAIDTVVDAVLADTNELQTNQGNWLTATTVNLNADQSGVTIGTVTTLTGHTAQTGDTYALANGATGFAAIAGFLDTEIAAILEDTGTSLPALIAGPVTLADGAHGGASASITLSDYSDFQGAAGSDPWGTALPGAYAVGKAGYILGTNLDAQVSVLSGGLSGDYTVTITIDDGSDPIENATVRVYRTGESETKQTDASGVAVFTIDAATWSVALTAAGYTGQTNSLVVSADASQTYTMVAGGSATGWVG